MSTTTRPIALVVLAHALGVLTVGSIAVTLVAGILEGESLVQELPFVLLLLVTLAVGWLLAVRLPPPPRRLDPASRSPRCSPRSAPLNLFELGGRDVGPRGVSQWIDWYNGTDDNPSWAWLPPVWLLLSQLPLRFPTGRPALLRAGAGSPGSRSPTSSWSSSSSAPRSRSWTSTDITRNPVFIPAIHDLAPISPWSSSPPPPASSPASPPCSCATAEHSRGNARSSAG